MEYVGLIDGLSTAIIGESVENSGLEVAQFYGNECEVSERGGCSRDGLAWGCLDMGSPYFCTAHFFPQEQLGYEFINVKETK